MEEAKAASKNAPLIGRIKKLRVDTNKVLQEVEGGSASDNMKRVAVKLKEARHWMGEELGRLGQELPQEFQDKS